MADEQEDHESTGEAEELEYTQGGGPGLPTGDEEASADTEVLPAGDLEASWEEEGVREHLMIVGSGVHELIGKAEKDWEMSKRDLDRMAPPLTRILNRYEPTRAASVYSDPLLFGYGAFMYASRSVLQRNAALLAKREEEEGRGGEIEESGGYEDVSSEQPPSQNGRPPETRAAARRRHWQ